MWNIKENLFDPTLCKERGYEAYSNTLYTQNSFLDSFGTVNVGVELPQEIELVHDDTENHVAIETTKMRVIYPIIRILRSFVMQTKMSLFSHKNREKENTPPKNFVGIQIEMLGVNINYVFTVTG